MPSPKDVTRIAAFRRWYHHTGGVDAASSATGIGTRTIQRMIAGKQPPPVKLLEELATRLADQGGPDEIVDMLTRAARADEMTNA